MAGQYFVEWNLFHVWLFGSVYSVFWVKLENSSWELPCGYIVCCHDSNRSFVVCFSYGFVWARNNAVLGITLRLRSRGQLVSVKGNHGHSSIICGGIAKDCLLLMFSFLKDYHVEVDLCVELSSSIFIYIDTFFSLLNWVSKWCWVN